MFAISRRRTRRLGVMAAGAAVATAFVASPALALTSFSIPHTDLGAGFALTGTIQTNGAVGALSAADITGWNIRVTSVTDTHYTPANTINVSSGVTSSGGQLLVPTSPDGFSDGGSLAFRGGNHFQVQVADFTGANTAGGQAFYVAGGAFDIRPLNRPNGIDYVAANEVGATPVFNLVPLHFLGGEVMSGTITTDGSTGPAVLTDWDILVRETQSWLFNPSNSSVLGAINLFSDGHRITVTPFDPDGNPGQLQIGGFNGFDFNGVLLGDFTFDPGGVTGLVTPSIFQVQSPVTLDAQGNFLVASAPEPVTWALMLVGFFAVGQSVRRRGLCKARTG